MGQKYEADTMFLIFIYALMFDVRVQWTWVVFIVYAEQIIWKVWGQNLQPYVFSHWRKVAITLGNTGLGYKISSCGFS